MIDPRIAAVLPTAGWRTGIDARAEEAVRELIRTERPDVVVNCIGVVKQRVEVDDLLMVQINALLPHQLAKVCSEIDARLIHMSTDCVFSGRSGGYSEANLPDPPDLYGRTKLAGEPSGDRTLTIRTSIIGWELVTAQGLAEWFRSQRGGTVRGFTRAIYSGLTTAALAEVILSVIEDHSHLSGTYHVASDPISKHDLLGILNDRMNLGVHIIPDDATVCDRRLDGSHFVEATGLRVPTQAEMIGALAEDRGFYDVDDV